MSPVRIVLLSDDRLFCDGVTRFLQAGENFAVSIYDTIAALEAAAVTADVLVIDSRMDGSLAIVGSRTVAPASLLIAAPNDAAWCRDALCAGASGVLPKNTGGGVLIDAVRAVADGSIWAPRRVLADCIRHLVTTSLSRNADAVRFDRTLSRREREIFHHAATGLANKELAARLAIGEATVKAHMTKIFQKLGVRGRAELAAVYHGVAPMQPPMVVRQRSNGMAVAALKK